jgi:hypothetical protein
MKKKSFYAVAATLIIGMAIFAAFSSQIGNRNTKDVLNELESEGENSIKIGIVADVHIRDGNRAQLADWNIVKPWLETFLNRMEEWKADFNIELGDLNDGHTINPEKGDGHEDRLIKGKAVWESSMAGWRKHKVPFYYVMGNHEVQNNRNNDTIAKLKGMPGSYYSFDKKNYHFIILDTNYRGLEISNTFRIPKEQLDWLKQDLASTSKKTILFLHCPIDTAFGIGGTKPVISKAYNTVENEEEVRKILEEAGNVILVLEGHAHSGMGPEANEPKESITNGIRYWYVPSFNASISCYAKLTISKKGCKIEYDNDPNAINGAGEKGSNFKMTSYSFDF